MQFLESLLPPHFTRRNRIIFFLAIFFSLISLVALLKVAPKDETQSRKMLATLVDQNQYVTRKFSNSLSFIEVDKGDKLFNGDQIFTGENSTAKVVFTKSGNILNIPPRGLVKIEEGQSGENVDIQKGLAEFVIQKGQSINIVQGNETITLKANDSEQGTGKIFFNDKKIVLQVDSGKISMNDAKGKVQEVNKNESFTLDGNDITKVAGVGLTSPVWGQKIDIWQGLSLEWTNKGTVEAVLARDSGFTDIVGRVTAPRSPHNWTLPLEEGRYYLMVKPANNKIKEGTSFPLEMYSAHSIKTFSPADHSQISLKRGEGIRLSWNEVPAQKYKVTVYDQDGKSKVLMTQTPELVISDVKGSTIEWSVAPQLRSGSFLADSVTNHIGLTYDGENKIISPKAQQGFIFGKEKINLAWAAAKNERIHIKLTNTNQNQVVLDKDTLENQIEFDPEAPGAYSFEVLSKDYPNAVPAKIDFTVVAKIADWESKAPVELGSIDAIEQKVELKFSPMTKDLSEIELSIYSDEALKNKITSSKVLSGTIIYTVKKFGTFCFILRPLNKSSVWLPSGTQCIINKEMAPFDVIANTKNIILKYTKVNGVGSYLINLPVVERAVSYEVQVFDGAQKVVFADKSRSNVITWPSNKTGIYYYKYRVVDSKGRISDYSGVSKLIFPISPLTEWRE
jgi:hypothetical protein